MNNRNARMFSAMVVAIMLMFVGDVVWTLTGEMVGGVDPASYPISLHNASIIAQDTAPNAKIIGTPVLTSYQGTAAYMVPMDTRTIYVEATTGRILVNTVSTAMSGGQGN